MGEHVTESQYVHWERLQKESSCFQASNSNYNEELYSFCTMFLTPVYSICSSFYLPLPQILSPSQSLQQ